MSVTERFLEYVKRPTASDETSGKHPSTDGQLILAKELAKELSSLGLICEGVDKYGYVYATLPATREGKSSIALIAHMDTSPEASGEGVRPAIIEYLGGDIVLNEAEGIVMRAQDYPTLSDYVGKRLIVTDGTTLLGADDKAGIAEIMSALEIIIKEQKPHGEISVVFTPDEEIGEGADNLDLSKISADYAYTVDGGALGEVEYENFNAASAAVTVKGRVIHPGSAKGRMKNAARIICEFNSMLPDGEIPERTEGYEGFYHMISLSADCESARASYIIRDHDMTRFEGRKAELSRICAELNRRYGEGTVELEIRDSYYNMREIIEKNMFIVERARNAMRSLGITPVTQPIRGGTDGARLSFMGLPCPNLSTGGENFHSRFEFVCVESMEKMTEGLVKIISDAAEAEYIPIEK